MMRILIPVLENKDKESQVSYHFGRAPFFAIYESAKDELKIVENKSEHFGGRGRPAENMLSQNPDVVFAKGMGPRAVNLLKSKNIRIETGDFDTVREIIQNKDKLKELEEACEEHKH